MKHSIFNLIFSSNCSVAKSDTLISKQHFLEHYKKFQPVLEQIKQNDEQKSATLRLTINNVCEKKTANSQELIHLVTLPDESINTRAQAISFLDRTLDVSSQLKFKDPERLQSCFKSGLAQYHSNPDDLLAIKHASLAFKNTAISNHPDFQQAVYNCNSSLDSSSLPYVEFLVEYSKVSEVLTGVAVNDKIALAVGIKVFILTYYSLQDPNSLQFFLTAVKKSFQSPSFLPNIYSTVYEKRYYFVSTIGGALLTSVFLPYGRELTSVVVETGKYLPKSELVQTIFFSTREHVQSALYMVGSIIGGARRSLFCGLFEDAKPLLQGVLKEGTKVLKALKDSTK